MRPRDRKLLILRELGEEADPLSLGELCEKLGSAFTSRTTRRWVGQLVEEGFVQKTGNTRGTRYVAVRTPGREGKKEERPQIISSCFSSDSLKAIRHILRPLFERQPVTYNREWLESYVPNESFYLSSRSRQQLMSAGQRTSGHDPAGTYAHQIFNRLMIDLSYNSSRLEGNTYSLLDTERLLLHGDSAVGKLDMEKVMILNHKEAIRYLVDNAPKLEVNRNVIHTLHYLLADGLVEPAETGKVRKGGVRIGGSTYVPFENPKHLEEQLEVIAAKARLISNPFEKSIFLLVHMSYLQAFVDVNKRTARLSANIPLIQGNLVPLAFSDIRVEDYQMAMIAIYELQDVRPLRDLYVYSYLRTCAAYDATVKSLGFDEVRVRYRQERRGVVRGVIIHKHVQAKMRKYIEEEARKWVPDAVRDDFVADVLEDLEQIDDARLIGLGVTSDQLRHWLWLRSQ